MFNKVKTMEKEDSPSMDKYFSNDSQGGNFFDQISTSNSVSETDISKSMGDIKLKETEPVVCKIFATTPEMTNDKNFFDILTPVDTTDSETLVNFDSNNEGPYPSPLQGFEDAFGVLNGPETYRTREAWIPSEETRKALIMAATSPPGSFTPDKNLLTMPGVTLEDELVCELNKLIKKYSGEEEVRKRKIMTLNDVPHDEKGLKELIQNRCFRAAVNLTSKLLSVYGQGFNRQNTPSKHTVHSIQLWFTRLCLLVKLNIYEVAYVESNVWWNLDRPDLYYQFYPELYGGKLGTMVPFQMRLLVATIPAYVSQYSVSLERLYSILSIVKKVLNNLESGKTEEGSSIELPQKEREIAKQVWKSRESRVQHSIINVALMSKRYTLAIEVLEDLISKNNSRNQKRALLSALGRIFLQLGDLINAEKCFSEAKLLKRQQQGTLSDDTADLRELIDKGLFSVAEKRHDQAYECFQKALMLDRSNITVINNMSFCLLYMGKLKQAVTTLVSTIKSYPETALNEALLLNVCTLFDLESSDFSQKKLLLGEIAKYKGDGLNIDCLKAIFQR